MTTRATALSLRMALHASLGPGVTTIGVGVCSLPTKADIPQRGQQVRFVPILLQKSAIRRVRDLGRCLEAVYYARSIWRGALTRWHRNPQRLRTTAGGGRTTSLAS